MPRGCTGASPEGLHLAGRSRGWPRSSPLLGTRSWCHSGAEPLRDAGRDAEPRTETSQHLCLCSDAPQEHGAGKCHRVPCSLPPAPDKPRGLTEQGGEGSIPGPLGSSCEGPAGSSRGHGGGQIRRSLRLPTPNPFATFRLPEAIGSGQRKGVPRAGAGALEAQPKVGGRGCAEPKPRALQTSSIPHCSRLPPAQRWTHARRSGGPRGALLRSRRAPPGLPALAALSWLRKPGAQHAATLTEEEKLQAGPGGDSGIQPGSPHHGGRAHRELGTRGRRAGPGTPAWGR